MKKLDTSKIKCNNCINLKIYEDQSEDMRKPFAICKLDNKIKEIGIFDWIPYNINCDDFKDGEPDYI